LARPGSASPGSVEPTLSSQSVRTTIPRAVLDRLDLVAKCTPIPRYNMRMTDEDDRIRQLEEQWRQQLFDDERMRRLPEWLDQKSQSSHALSRVRQGRPSGRRLRRSATL
jgi:hypothetical protein